MPAKASAQGNLYRIRVKGSLDGRFAGWLGDVAVISQENGETLLQGRFIDQPALRGCLEQFWDLNFTILSVKRMNDENTSKPSNPGAPWLFDPRSGIL